METEPTTEALEEEVPQADEPATSETTESAETPAVEVDRLAGLTDKEREYIELNKLAPNMSAQQILDAARYGQEAEQRETAAMYSQREKDAAAATAEAVPVAGDQDDVMTRGEFDKRMKAERESAVTEGEHVRMATSLGLDDGDALLLRGAVEKLLKTKGYTHYTIAQAYGVAHDKLGKKEEKPSPAEAIKRVTSAAKTRVPGGGRSAPVAAPKRPPPGDPYWDSDERYAQLEKSADENEGVVTEAFA